MPRPHVSGYFLIRNFFFPDMATVYTHPANSTAYPDIFKTAHQSGKNKSATIPITCGRKNPDIFKSDDAAKSCQVFLLNDKPIWRRNVQICRHYCALYGACSEGMLLQRNPGY